MNAGSPIEDISLHGLKDNDVIINAWPTNHHSDSRKVSSTGQGMLTKPNYDNIMIVSPTQKTSIIRPQSTSHIILDQSLSSASITAGSKTNTPSKTKPTSSAHKINSLKQLDKNNGPAPKTSIPIPSSSSSLSGPLFPPGFENFIPLSVKEARQKKRARKLKRKAKKQKAIALSLQKQTSKQHNPPEQDLNFARITSKDVLDLANTIGFAFDGPVEDLLARIDEVLLNQRRDFGDEKP